MQNLTRWWVGAESGHSRSRPGRLLIISLLAVCAATFALGVPRLHIYSHDVFICLDGAWRINNGQRPVVDFFASKGPAWFMLYAAALSLAGNDAKGLCYGITIVAVLMSLWAFIALRRRMEPAPFFLACISLVLLAVAPFPLGEAPDATSFAMTFNRYGFALASLVLLECFLPSSENDSSRKQFSGGFSSGLACAVMLFVKISYGMVGLVLVGASVLLRSRERVRWLGLIAGFAIFGLAILAWLRFDFAAILREYHVLAGARGGMVSVNSALRRVWQLRFEFMPVLLLTALGAWFVARAGDRRTALVLAVLLAAGGDLLLLLTNTQNGDLPLLAAVALLLVNEVTSALIHPKPPPGGLDIRAALTFLSFGLLACGIPLSMNAAGLTYALADKLIHPHAGYRFQAPHLRALEFAEESTSNPYDNSENFVHYTEEAMGLVSAHSGRWESGRLLMNTNPLSFALLRPPPRGGAIDINPANFSVTSMPPPEFVLGDVDLILIPAGDLAEIIKRNTTIQCLLSQYRSDLESRYLVEAESPHWKLLRKRALHAR